MFCNCNRKLSVFLQFKQLKNQLAIFLHLFDQCNATSVLTRNDENYALKFDFSTYTYRPNND